MSNTVEMAEPALQAVELSIHMGAKSLLNAINVQFPAARWTAIVGPNGAGKSTLLAALAGLQMKKSQQGRVELLGKPLEKWPSQQRARALSWMGQNEAVSLDLLGYDVAMLGRLPHQGWLAGPSAADHAVVEQCLERTHAWALSQRPLTQLSGGERQRVLLARALAVQAKVLLMDEPLANLDPPHQSDWMEIVQSLVGQGHTVISVLHELNVALQSDYMVVMQAAHVLHAGLTRAKSTHEALEAVFEYRIRIRQVDGVWVALPVVNR